ncbi:unnamed protein product [Prorocentrum cordatum]|uniref:Glycosyltransferase 2-like domain-containing protein n=1 Tax=Prorocentrum cordatum TaxID=2364126 RepID=A0ABN9XCQ3_9DINO|nr:unnamed protein product [Polarella glacialis]
MAAKALLATWRTAHEVPSAEFVVLDDGSSQDMTVLARVAETLQSLFGTRIQKWRAPEPMQYTVANTVALRLASGTYACLMNSDVFPLPGWLAAVYHTMRSFPGAGIVGPLQVNPSGRVMEAGGTVFRQGHPYNIGRRSWPWDLPYLHSHVVDYISAACIMFNRTEFLGLGLFDPQFAPAYFEDTDAGLTMRRSGKLVVSMPLAVVVHLEGASYTDASKQEQMQKNQEKFEVKHANVTELHCPSPRGWAQTCGEIKDVQRATYFNTIRRQGTQVLVLDFTLPEADRDSGSVRMLELLEIMVRAGYGVTLQPESGQSFLKYVLPLLALGVHVLPPGSLGQMSGQGAGASHELSICPWQVAILSRRAVFKAAIEPLRRVCPTVPLIYDTVDLHFVRERRSVELALATGDTAPVFLGDTFVDVHKTSKEKVEQLLQSGEDLEVGFMRMSQYVLVVGSGEVDVAANKAGKSKVRLLTNIYPDPDPSITGLPFEERTGGLFVGSMCHTPNIDASKFIMREILGNHSVFPRGFMHMVWSGTSRCGALLGNMLEEAKAHPLITLHLDVTNEELYSLHMSTKFFLGALRVGAGVKGKLCHALLYGLPIIASEVASEGMFLQPDLNVLSASSPDSFVSMIGRVSSNKTLWHELRREGMRVIEKRFSRRAARDTLTEIFTALGIVPRVADTGSSFRALTTWECPLPEDLGGKKGLFPGRMEADCWSGRNNPWFILPPPEPYRDEFLRDHIPRPTARPMVPRSCPTGGTPTSQRPFIYHHIVKTGGLSIRRVVAEGAASHGLTTAIPCVGTTSCQCNIMYNTPLSQTSTCMESDQFKSAAVYLGHYAPLPLARLNPTDSVDKLCFVMVRRPIDRAVAHYARFGVVDQFNGQDMDKLTLSDLDLAVRRTGGGEYMTRYLGCVDEEQCSEALPSITRSAKAELRRCHVGLTDQFKTTLAYLKILLPWLDLESIADIHARPASYVDGKELMQRMRETERGDAMLRWYAPDQNIYDYGRGLFFNQTRHAIRCYGEKAESDETKSLRLLRTVSRKVRRKSEDHKWMVATCVERAVWCRQDVFQDMCTCSLEESQ